MDAKKIIAALEDKIAENRTKQVIKELRELLKDDNEHLKSLIINLSASYNRATESLLRNIKKHSEVDIEFNRINEALLEVISKLKDEDFKADVKFSAYGLTNPLLVICFDLIQLEELEAFFHQLDFQSVQIELAEQYNEAWNETAHLTIWNNWDLPHCPQRESMDKLKESERALIFKRLSFLETCLDKKPSPHFIHFGEQFFFVNEHRNCVNAANSFYTLYARIKETLDFINTYRA